MEAAPPSYEQAVDISHWDLVAGYLARTDLSSAILVSQEWNRIFSRALWGNPAALFPEGDYAVYTALAHLRWTLPWARLSLRTLVHTFRLPPANAEAYYYPRSDWLWSALQNLPKLQSFIVHGVPFFDHASLLDLRKRLKPGLPLFELRLLDVSNCQNATAEGLAEVLSRVPALVYLDLSWVRGAVDSSIISKLKHLRRLRVLKFCGLSLTDQQIARLARAIGCRVRSLDLRSNKMSDVAVFKLLDECVLNAVQRRHIEQSANSEQRIRSPDGLPFYVSPGQIQVYRSEQFEQFLYTTLSKDFVTRLALEDAIDVGLTHLYLSDNVITVYGAARLLQSAKLNVLDIGEMSLVAKQNGNPTKTTLDELQHIRHLLATCASGSLTYLRINHSIITEDSPDDANAETEVAVQTPITEDAPPYSEQVQSPTLDDYSESTDEEPEKSPGPSNQLNMPLSNLLEKVVSLANDPDSPLDDTEPHESPSIPSVVVSPVEPEPPSFGPAAQFDSGLREQTYNKQSLIKSIHALMLRKLRTLALTNVPSHAYNTEISDMLAQFLRECSQEAVLSNIRAKSDSTLR